MDKQDWCRVAAAIFLALAGVALAAGRTIDAGGLVVISAIVGLVADLSYMWGWSDTDGDDDDDDDWKQFYADWKEHWKTFQGEK